MAFFKFRKGAEEQSAPAPAPESVETLRKRARHRLLGAVILVIAGVIGFPLLFDNQPRPIAVDIPIDIPDKAKAKPLVVQPDSDAVAQGGTNTPAVSAAPASARPAAENATETKPALKSEEIISTSKPAAVQSSSGSAAEKPAAEKTVAKASEPAKPASADGPRFIVQFGSYTEPAKAHEARVKVEKSGMKTYAQTIQNADGKKFRVRVGPFDSRAEAEKAAAKIKKLDLPAVILEL